MLKTRIYTAIAMLLLFIPALFMLPNLIWAAMTLMLTLCAMHEWTGMVQLDKRGTTLTLSLFLLIGALLWWALYQWSIHWFFFVSLLICAVCSLFWLLVVPVALYRHRFTRNRLINTLLGAALLMALWMAMVSAQALSPSLLLIVIATIWLADSAAYFTGKQFGKHKLAPAISPGKTWEGVIGAMLAVALYGLMLFTFGLADTWWILPCLWLVTVVGIYGDLFESFFKRRANLKDSGQLLPGHGGLLDRIDGVIPALPVALTLVYAFYHWPGRTPW